METLREFLLPRGRIVLREGDITQQRADAIVNAANSRLAGGGGVDGAIHRAAGPELLAACRVLGGCPTGSAVITPAFHLPARFVIHAVGPVWRGGGYGEADLLRDAYHACLDLAEREALRVLAFPSLSTGAYGYPMEQAAEIALEAASGHLKREGSVEEIIFVLFGAESGRIFVQAGTRAGNKSREQEA